MLKSERINFLAKKVAPNPLEATYWIDLTEGPQGTVWKWFDPEDNIWKVLLLGNQEGSLDAYTKAESDRLFATNDSIEQLANELNTKQDTLVSEVNIRTINGISVLGSGDIHIDRGLNQEQVQDMIDESTKDFITVDETHEYVQEEIEKLKLVVLDKDKLSESISNLIFSNIVDFETLKEDLSITENHLLYVDPDNGMYRVSYNPNKDEITYTYTTIDKGELVQVYHTITSTEKSEYTVRRDIVNYTDNVHDGITITNQKQGTTRNITLYTRGTGESYLSDDGQYKVIGSINLYTSMDRLPDCLAVLLDDDQVEVNRFADAKQYLTDLNEPVYLLLTDIYNESVDQRTIEGNQLYSFYYDSVSDSIYIVGTIEPLHQIYNTVDPQPIVTEVTQITNTAKIVRRRITNGLYTDTEGFDVRIEDDTFDSVDDPTGTTTIRSLSFITEGNGKDVLFNDGKYRNLQDSIDFSNFLGRDNETPYTPTRPYHPATKKYVDDSINALIDSAPSDLNTLRKLANAINNDPNFHVTITDLINTKEDHVNIGEVSQLQTDSKVVVPAINEHEAQINQAQSDIDALEEQDKKHDQQISDINTELDVHQNSITDLYNQVDRIDSNIDDIEKNLSDNVDRIDQNIDAIETNIDNIEVNINNIETNIDAIEGNINKIENNIDSIEQNIDQIEQDLSDNVDRIDSTISDIQDNITTIEGDITQIEQDITDIQNKHTEDITNLTEDITNLTNKHNQDISTITNKHNQDISEITEDINNIQAKDSQQDQSISDINDQLDILNNTLDFDGDGSKYLADDGTYKVFPTKVSQFQNDSNYQTKTQVDQAIADLVGSAPETLDTLNELADALGNDPNFATTVANQIGLKADKANIGDVTQLTTTAKIVVPAINEHETQINSNTSSINNINTQITEINQQIEDINNSTTGDITQINQDIDNIQQDITNIESNISSINTNITAIEGDITDIQGNISNIEGDITNIKQNITSIEGDITDIQGDITNIEGDITEIINKNNQQDTEIASKFELPTGGTTGQVLKKQADGTMGWANDNDTVVTWNTLSGKPTLATVATSGSYNDLTDKPTIPSQYVLPTASSSTKGGIFIGYAETGQNYPVELDNNSKAYVNVPWVNTTYNNASSSVAGLMSSADKTKLDGIQAGADAVSFTRNLSSGTKIGTININGTSTDIYAPTSESGGSSVSYTPTVTSGVKLGTITIDGASTVIYAPEDAGSDVTWSATQTSGTKIGTLNVDGTDYVLYAPTPTTYNIATTTQSGLMSFADKSKLDGIRAGADKVEWSGSDQATATTLGLVKIGYSESGKNYPVELNSSGQMFVNVPWTDTNTTYSVATTTTDGLMSSEDKTKLDSISSGYNLPIATTTTLGGVKSTDSPYQATSTKKVYHYYNDGDISFHLVGSLYCSNLIGTSSGDYFDPAYGTSAVDKVYNTPFPIDDTITDLFPDDLTYTTCSVAIEIPGLADEELYENTYLKVLCNLKTPPISEASNNRVADYLVFADSNSYYVADFDLLGNGIGVTTFSLKGYITPTCINYLNTHTNVKAYYVCLCSYKQVIEDSQYTYSDAYSNVDFYRRPSIGKSKITSNTKVTGYTGIQGFYDTLQQIDSTAEDCPNLEYILYEINNSEAETPEINSYYVTVEDSGKMRVDTPSAFEYVTLKQGDEGFTVEIEDGSGVTEAYVTVYIPSKYTQKYNHIKIEDLVVKYSLECYDKYHSGMIVASYKYPIQYSSTWGEEELIPVYFAPQGTLSQPRTIFVNCYKTVTQATDGGYSAMMQFSTPQESSYSLTAITVVQVYMNLICYN